MSFSKSQIADGLEIELNRSMAELIAGNVTGIVKELTDAEDGTLTVGFAVKLNLTGNRVAGTGVISYSRKFKDETDFITPDPDQPGLPGLDGSTVTLRAPGMDPVTVSGEQFKEASRRVGKRGAQ